MAYKTETDKIAFMILEILKELADTKFPQYSIYHASNANCIQFINPSKDIFESTILSVAITSTIVTTHDYRYNVNHFDLADPQSIDNITELVCRALKTYGNSEIRR